MPERITASSATRLMSCHASADLSTAIPGWTPPPDNGETEASRKGTNMHEVLEASGDYSPKEQLALARAMEYVAHLRAGRRFTMLLEQKAPAWWLQQKPNAKADVVLYTQDEIHVVDYKFGRNPVYATDNDQMRYYALAFMALAPKAKYVTTHIVQPLIDNFDYARHTVEELDQFRLESARHEREILAGDVAFGPGDHCTFCPANPHGRGGRGSPSCPVMLKLLYPSKPLDEEAILDA